MTFLGTPIHPALVHLPIGLFLGAWGLYVVSLLAKQETLYKAAMAVYVMAAFSTLLTVSTGLLEQDRLHLHHPLVESHRNFGIATMVVSWLSLALMWGFRRRNSSKVRLIFAISCWVCAGLVLTAGYLGGEMVFHYAIGVDK